MMNSIDEAMSKPKTEYFVVVVEDPHCDAEVELWCDEEDAVNRARHIARDRCLDMSTEYGERSVDGWLFYADYCARGGSVHVKKVKLNTLRCVM